MRRNVQREKNFHDLIQESGIEENSALCFSSAGSSTLSQNMRYIIHNIFLGSLGMRKLSNQKSQSQVLRTSLKFPMA